LLVGRRGAGGPSECFERLAVDSGASPHWHIAGDLGVIASFLILSFYSVVGGWSISYVIDALQNNFSGASSEQTEAIFNHLLADPARLLLWHSVFMLMVAGVVARGISHGIERVLSIIMPVMFLLLLGLVAYAFTLPAFGKTLAFLFQPDFSSLSSKGVLLALGQAFFSLSVGGGGIINYGSYLDKQASIPRSAFAIAGANVSVDMLAGMAIFPIVFAFALEPAAGPGLLFVTLPVALGQMPGGLFIGTLFLLLVLFAALSTSISMLESTVSRLIERPGASRRRMTLIAGGLAWLIGLGSVFSHNIWSDFMPLNFIPMFEGATIFRIIDFFVVNNLILLSAFFITLFVGWVMSTQATQEELGLSNTLGYRSWHFIMRYLAPVAIFLVAAVTILSY